MIKKFGQSGAAPVLILVAVIGLVGFLAISSSVSFRSGIFATLFPKKESSAAAPLWQSISPAGVSIDFNNPPNNYGFNSIVVDPVNQCVFMGTNYQGIYKTCNQGSSWVKIDTGTGSSMIDGGRIWGLAMDPFSHNIIYAASGYGFGGPLKSTDGGVSWTHMLPSTNVVEQQIKTNDIYTVATDPYLANHVLITFHYFWHDNQDSGVLESMDGGNSWIVHNPPSGSGWGAGNSIWFLNNSQSWILGSQSAGYWKTTNSGASWTQVMTTNMSHGGIYSFYRSPISGLLYTAVWNGIWKSIDNGNTWTDFATGLGLPYAGYGSIIGDGSNLYTAPSGGGGGDNGQSHGPWYTTAEKTAPTSWSAYNSQQTCSSNICNGPISMAYDSVNHIVYSVNWLGGVWKLQTSGSSGTPPPTAAPTPTPVATPTPMSTPSPTPGGSVPANWGTSAIVSPATVSLGSNFTVNASVTSSLATNALIDIEIYNGANKVFQQFYDNQAFIAGQTRVFSPSFTSMSTDSLGSYIVRIGVFLPSWGTLLSWNDSAGAFNITGSGPTATPAPTPNPLPGDINGSKKVDILDYNLLITDFGATSGVGLRSDINNSGKVDILDYNLLITNYGKSIP